MFAKGKIRGNGAQLARYLMTGEESERVELFETRGLEAFGPNPVAAFAALQNVADANTHSTKPFFHGHIRLPANERLADVQWMQTLNLMEKRLGFEGQPRIVTFHIDRESGDKHLHVGWFRIDLETMRAIDPGLYKNELRQLCREQERAYGLRQLDNEGKKPQGHEASQNETEESRRLGTDLREIRDAILDCVQRSDNGRAFNAMLEERGLMLANGDRRDCFVVIDQAGGQHVLNKKLTGMKLATIRARFADLDRSQLPGVEQAQDMQRNREAERAGQKEPANQNIREPMTFETITRDTWKAVDLALPKDADRTLLAAVALCADQCAKVAFAYGRTAIVVEPEAAAFYRERHDSAAARRDDVRSALARLPPEQAAQVSPFMHPELVAQKAKGSLEAERARQILARDPTHDMRPITAEAIRENPWNVLWHRLPQDAGRDLAEQVWTTARHSYHEAIQHRDAAFTAEERQLWGHYAGVMENVPFRAAGERLAELDLQEIKAAWRDAERETGQRQPPPVAPEVEAAAELAATAEAAVDQATHAGEGLLRGLGKMFESVISWLADSIAPPPPPTKEQAERNARASEERREQRTFDQAEEQQRALREFLNAETLRTQQAEAERDPRLAEMMNLHTQASSSRRPESEAERDRD